jgi:hypothetical protein
MRDALAGVKERRVLQNLPMDLSSYDEKTGHAIHWNDVKKMLAIKNKIVANHVIRSHGPDRVVQFSNSHLQVREGQQPVARPQGSGKNDVFLLLFQGFLTAPVWHGFVPVSRSSTLFLSHQRPGIA